ncbi:MAG: DNA translocase FtsK, partial [Eubacteriales bacterium]|nr:DNA translocase FtsK [Eubacteriales bacterium]
MAGRSEKKSKSRKQNIPPEEMERSKARRQQVQELQEQRREDRLILDKIWGVIFLAVGAFLIITTQMNTTGAFGNVIHSITFGLFGVMAYVLPYYFVAFALCLFFQKVQHINGRTTFFSILMFLMLCILNSYRFLDPADIRLSFSDIGTYFAAGEQLQYGGAVGMTLGGIIVKLIGKPGLIIFALAGMAISVLLVADTPISKYISKLRERKEEQTILKEMMEEERIARASEPGGVQILNPVKEGSIDLTHPGETGGKTTILQPMDDESRAAFFHEVQNAEFSDVYSEEPTEVQNAGEPVDVETPFTEAASNPDTETRVETGYGLEGYGLDASYERPAGTGLGLSEDWSSVTPAHITDNGSGSYGLTGTAPETADFSAMIDEPVDEEPRPQILSAEDVPEKSVQAVAPVEEASVPKSRKVTAAEQKEMLQQVEAGAQQTAGRKYEFPPVDLLRKPKNTQLRMNDHQLSEKAALLENTLQNFHVDARVLNVTQGSSVTRYEVQPAVGVKVNSITKLADDIALNLRAKSIRIEAPIPGKAAVGIEVENEKPAMVTIRELIDSKEFREAPSKISFVVGKDISGNNIVANLKDMPHLLIAGATGSGKSVCINTIITSLLYKASPDEVKLILIDPKVVELGNYNGIPHMLIPVVTDPKKAAAALNWAVNEMTQRYKLFAEESVKDLDSYNELMEANQEPEKVLPKIVIIIDELADLMMAAPSQVEESICRLAQLARAAGMHLIVATQRPSVDIVTGLIKANIPSRIAFSVSSQFDSRTILDVGGAEKLLGKGDMLYSPVGENKPIRIQGPYISDSETAKIISFVKNQGESDYDEKVIET